VLSTPATLFESDRRKILQAIDQTQPGAGPVNIQEALEFAQEAQRVQSHQAGEIVFAGTGRVVGDQPPVFQTPANLRVLPLAGPTEHAGLRKVSVRRSLTDPDSWEVFIVVKNYGERPRSAPLGVQFGGSPVATRRFDLKPGGEENATFRFKTRAAGWLEARLLTQDVFLPDTRAVLELPARKILPVLVYSAEPDLLRPVFNAIPGVQATFQTLANYDANLKSGIVLLDRFAPPAPPAADSIWIEPPAGKSPIPSHSAGAKVKLKRWRTENALGAGLRTKDVEVTNAEAFDLKPDDVAIAESDAGALIAARPGKPKVVVLGFHPVRSGMKYELTTPLLFANILRWMAPDIFRSWELTAGTVGTVDVELEAEADPSTVRVMTEEGKILPFTTEGQSLRFFAGSPGIVRVLTGDRELVYSLTLPQPGDVIWTPVKAKHGLTPRAPLEAAATDIWQWLAILGGLCLLADWIFFGRMQKGAAAAAHTIRRAIWRKAS